MTFPSLQNILLGKKYMSIEHFSSDNEEKMTLLLIEKKKNGLVITQKDKRTYSSILPEKFDKKLPFYLVINTNQVIQKEISEIDVSDEKLLHKAFPNLVWNEFYYEIWRLKTKSVIAISRKTYVNEIVSVYQKQGISVVGISLGICSISGIVNYSPKEEVATNHQNISWKEDNPIITAKTTPLSINYDINGLEIPSTHLLAFFGVLRILISNRLTSGNLTDYNHILYDDYNQKSFFSKGIQAMVGLLLVLLLFNFFVFNNYYKKVQDISEQLLLNNSSQEEILKTKERVKIKELKGQNILGTSSVQSSLLINEIAKQIPSSILLTELIYNPLEKKIKIDEPITIQEKTITISGTTISNSAFTKWIEEIEKFKFIKEVVITNFGKNETAETLFSVKLILK
jgi:Tfp pilus assembly protein PilN